MNLSNKLAQKIASELNYDDEKKAVINYGIFAFLQILASLFLVALFGLLLGVVAQALVVSFASSILRQYSGGVHASRPSICLIIGTVVTIGIAVIAHYVSGLIAAGFIIAVDAVLIIVSYLLVCKYAPVDSPAKPIKTESRRKKMKRFSLVILSAYLICVAILVIVHFTQANNVVIEYSLCICLAIGWQVFNLTIIGHSILTKVDSLLKKVLLFKRRNLNEEN